jgi:hypothetical protein
MEQMRGRIREKMSVKGCGNLLSQGKKVTREVKG